MKIYAPGPFTIQPQHLYSIVLICLGLAKNKTSFKVFYGSILPILIVFTSHNFVEENVPKVIEQSVRPEYRQSYILPRKKGKYLPSSTTSSPESVCIREFFLFCLRLNFLFECDAKCSLRALGSNLVIGMSVHFGWTFRCTLFWDYFRHSFFSLD